MATEKTTVVTEKVLTMKLLVDTKAQRVLFAEAEKELIDFLFSLLALPLGAIIELITKKNMVGSMGNLYESVETISSTYVQPNLDKNSLLKPKVLLSAENIPLLPSSVRPAGAKYYRCSNDYSHSHVTNLVGTRCPSCGDIMSTEVSYVGGGTSNVASADVGGYVKGVVTYMVTDELVVMPMSTISSITLLKKFNVGDVGSLEEKIVDFGLEEGLEVLKSALQSKAVLTEVFLGRKKKTDAE
ncbi:hypothetical protein AQUCO_02700256v1 [Aquilegia coerulea]|uniref:DUF674 domain-containing protein n=1 Tax=Aquilegia coerulea TaxID=218851 RepID=A0A2G5D5Y6_AQUCA|nr:hypothetical protein AQUCO_02700256v1 [Aquilegia coerulea]